MGEFIGIDIFLFLVFVLCITLLVWSFGWFHKIKERLRGGEKEKNNHE